MFELNIPCLYLLHNNMQIRYDLLHIKPLFNDLLVSFIHSCIGSLQSIVDRFLVEILLGYRHYPIRQEHQYAYKREGVVDGQDKREQIHVLSLIHFEYQDEDEKHYPGYRDHHVEPEVGQQPVSKSSPVGEPPRDDVLPDHGEHDESEDHRAPVLHSPKLLQKLFGP